MATDIIDYFIYKNYMTGKKAENQLAGVDLSLENQLCALQMIADFYVKNYPGILYSQFLEGKLLEISRQLPVENKTTVRKKTTLHVATQVDGIGGHTRVIKHWIENNTGQRHDLYLTNQCQIPEWLQNTVITSNGLIIQNSASSLMDKAVDLRKTAGGYDEIVLHVGREDLVPIIAFGHGFEKPVTFYNHADHLFWPGISIADLIYDLNDSGYEITKKYRKGKKNYVLPIPLAPSSPDPNVDQSKSQFTTNKLRNYYGINKDETLLITMAFPPKFRGSNNIFFKKMKELIRPGFKLLLIGPENKGPFKKLAKQTGNRVIPVGTKPIVEAIEHLACADIYVDSFPISSYTSMLQALEQGLPVISTFPYGLPYCLKNNRVDDLKNCLALPKKELLFRYYKPARKLLSDHHGNGWLKIYQKRPSVNSHTLSLPEEKFTIVPYSKRCYSSTFKIFRGMRKIIRFKRGISKWIKQSSNSHF